MTENTPSPLGNVITIDHDRIKGHLDRVVQGSVEVEGHRAHAQGDPRKRGRCGGSCAAVRLTGPAELADAAVEETLTYYAFPEEHWRRNRPLIT